MLSYSFSIAGKDHVRCGLPCQDYSLTVNLPNGWIISAVADGVGSAARADEGSEIAVRTAVTFCLDNFPTSSDTESILAMLLLAFHSALKAIHTHAEEESAEVEAFDTTLTLTCFFKGRLLYAHCGDGGIFTLDRFGEAKEITEPQKSEDGESMIPLRFGSQYWVITEHSESAPMVLLATDGVRDKLSSNDFRNSTTKVYIPLLLLLGSISDFSTEEVSEFTQRLQSFLAHSDVSSSEWLYHRLLTIYERYHITSAKFLVDQIQSNGELSRFLTSIADDISIAVVNEPSIPMTIDMPDEYFADPDWHKVRLETHRRLYPHLHSEYSTTSQPELELATPFPETCEGHSAGNAYEIDAVEHTPKSKMLQETLLPPTSSHPHRMVHEIDTEIVQHSLTPLDPHLQCDRSTETPGERIMSDDDSTEAEPLMKVFRRRFLGK